MKVAVVGARGRMGSETCRAIAEADGLELVAAVDAGDSLSELVESSAEVLVEDSTNSQSMPGTR